MTQKNPKLAVSSTIKTYTIKNNGLSKSLLNTRQLCQLNESTIRRRDKRFQSYSLSRPRDLSERDAILSSRVALVVPLGSELQARRLVLLSQLEHGVQVGVHAAQQLAQRGRLHAAHVRHTVVEAGRSASAERHLRVDR